jgi:hypothetical protein
MSGPWHIPVGSSLRRVELHEQYGGRRQNGISMSRQSPNVFLFTSATGVQYGYEYDGWEGPDLYKYTGEGQLGDQDDSQGNGAILNHQQEGRALRLFEADGTTVTYIGEFVLDPEQPYELADAPDLDGSVRTVYVFRLRPVGAHGAGRAVDTAPSGEVATETDVETYNAGTVEVEVFTKKHTKHRREAELVERYRASRRRQGLTTRRHRIRPPGDPTLIYTDVYDVEEKRLLEAKASTARVDVRMAIGQLLDYRRFLPAEQWAVLLPARPRHDLLDLLDEIGIGCVYEVEPESGKFETA